MNNIVFFQDKLPEEIYLKSWMLTMQHDIERISPVGLAREPVFFLSFFYGKPIRTWKGLGRAVDPRLVRILKLAWAIWYTCLQEAQEENKNKKQSQWGYLKKENFTCSWDYPTLDRERL